MNQKNKIMEIYGLWFVDLVTIGISFILATYLRFGNFRDMGDKTIHFQVCLLFLLFCTIYTFFLDWNRNFLKRSILKELEAVTQYHVIMLLIVQTVMYFLQWAEPFSRFVMGLFMILNMVLTLFAHVAIKQALRMHYRSDLSQIKILIITQREMAAQVIGRLKESLDVNYRLVGVACPGIDKEVCGEIDSIPLIPMTERFIEDMTLTALDEVFIHVPDLKQKQVEIIIGGFDEMGVDCHYCLEMPGFYSDRGKLDNFGNYSVITYTRFQSSYKRLLIKRVMDIAGGLVGIVITLIFFPFVALAIKLDSPGPVLFSQIRIGRNGRRFKIYKFRSMYIDAEERKKELEKQNEMQGLMFKMENDPRITRVGKFIRKTSIDELPQFYNVLKGDMSLVGTRPPTADEFEKYTQYYRRRISMTPGLTGLWQVSGRSEIEDFDDVVKYDLEYIDGWSLTLDIKILIKTIWVVFAGKGSK